MDQSEDEKASAADSSMTITIVGAICIVLAVISTALRFYARVQRKAGLWWDDWFALVAVLSAVGTGVLVLAASLVDPDAAWLLSANDPNYNYTPANQLDLKLVFIANILYFTVVGAAKVSLLFMYTRIFAVSTNFRAQVWVLGAIVAASWATGTFGTLFNCWPIYWTWLNSLNPVEYCINYNVFWLVMGVVEEVLDVCILALPVRHIMKLQLSFGKKVGVASIFLLGGLVIITGIVKAIQGWNNHPDARTPHWDLTEVWSSVHASTGIMCACLPVCWHIIARWTGFLRLPSLSSFKMRSWWQSYRRSRAASRSRLRFSGKRSRDRESSRSADEEALPQEAVAMAHCNAGSYYPPPVFDPPPPDQNHIRVDTRVDVDYPPQVQYVWDTARISGQQYQQLYGYVPQISSGGGGGGGPHVGQYYHAVQGADGRIYWAQGNPV